MLKIFRNDCHSIPDYYRDIERISAQSDSDVASSNLKNGDKNGYLEHNVKVGSLVIKTDGLSGEEIKEAETLGSRFKEIDDEIFDINMTLGLKYPDYAMRTHDTDAHKNIKKAQEVTLQEAREAVQAYDELRTQLQARLDDAKLRAYSESSIPQGVRLEIQKQLEEKKKQQESDKSFEMPIAPKIEENPVIQMPDEISEEFDEGKAIFSQDEEGQTAVKIPDSERADLGKSDALFINVPAADKSLQDEAAENDETEDFPTAAQVDEEEPSEVVNDCESQAEEGKEAFIQGNRKKYTKEELNEILSQFKISDSATREEQSPSSKKKLKQKEYIMSKKLIR